MDFGERCCNNGGVVHDWLKYLSWQEKASFVRSDSDAAAFILCEREKLAQLVSGEYAAQESAEIGKSCRVTSVPFTTNGFPVCSPV